MERMRVDPFEVIVWVLALIVTGMLVGHWTGMY
jgi:hypothetical protein